MTKSHPLEDIELTISNFKCFGQDECGFTPFRPINIIIGRNNTGKSALIDAIDLCIKKGKNYNHQLHAHLNSAFTVKVHQFLDEHSLQQVFPEHTTQGGIPARNHWEYGKKFIGQPIRRSFGPTWAAKSDLGPKFEDIRELNQSHYIQQLANSTIWPFEGLQILRVAAERDVNREGPSGERKINPNGKGATNVIRAFLTSDDLPREEVEQKLLEDLNTVYCGDSTFTRILCRENEPTKEWELFLEEENKGDIRLSQSGSSLKSIFIILSMLRLHLFKEKIDWKKVIFAVEEPENNLHPALLRRLLDFLASQRNEKGFTLLITTHSPIGIDWSSRRSDSQIIHVQHDGTKAKTRTAVEYQHNRAVIEDLDIRASDLLQANGVIWVEGPSDRIYLKRWIELFSDNELKEGTHYTIMFYGGKLLSHLDALPPAECNKLISLLSINRNAAVLIDSDRHPASTKKNSKPRMRLGDTKCRIRDEMNASDGYVWITEGREIENYTPIEVLARIANKSAPPKTDQYTQLVTLPFLKEFKEDKIEIAHRVAEKVEKDDLVGHLDLSQRLGELCNVIKQWNGI